MGRKVKLLMLYTIDELNEQLQYNEKESKLYIPNEVYKDLEKSEIKNTHIPFAFSYYYLICWIYRYTKYGTINNMDNKKFKKILGYSPTYPEIDYIIKKNGLLDQMEYTSTVKDFPISWTFEDNFLEFDLLSDLDEETQKIIKQQFSRKYSIKLPFKAFHRTKESEDDKYLDGTFYEVDNTHMIPFEVFLFCMSKKELGCTSFYLWCYLKMQNQIFNGGYDISLDDLSIETGIPRSTMCGYLNILREYGMVSCQHNQEFFCLALNEGDKKANTYTTNEFDNFSNKRVEFNRMKILSVKEFEKQREIKNEFVELFN